MTIKDFKVGQTAYLMDFEDRRFDKKEISIKEVVVVSIGKKYIKVKRPNSCYEMSFYQNDSRDSYLVEKSSYSNTNYLFQTKQAINEYEERKELLRWISDEVRSLRENQYTLEQFREIKRILENPKF